MDEIPFVATAPDEICRINADGTTTYHWDRIEAAAQRWEPGRADIAVCLSKLLLPLRPSTPPRPEALRLADLLEAGFGDCGAEAAAELRRLHDVEKAYKSACDIVEEQDKKLVEMEAVNRELLEALKSAAEYLHDKSGCLWLSSDFQGGCRCSEDCSSIAVWKQARAAIAKAEGEKK